MGAKTPEIGPEIFCMSVFIFVTIYGNEVIFVGGLKRHTELRKCSRLSKHSTKPAFEGERLFAVHGLSERTTVQTSSLLLRLFFFYLLANPTQPDPYR